MKILIISGFLGSGKTTFIQEMVKKTKKNFVIVENEFGELGVDGKLLNQDLKDDIKVWELTEGCICCSLNLDFTDSVLTIANTLNPDYLIVEPSGVAQLSNILEQLSKVCYEKIILMSPIVIVDAMNYKTAFTKYSDYFFNQLHHSSTVLLSKSEHLSMEEKKEIKKELEQEKLIPNFKWEHYSKWSDEEWDSLFQDEYLVEKDEHGKLQVQFYQREIKQEQPLENISFSNISIYHPAQLIGKLEGLFSKAFGDVVRAKGYTQIGNFWFRFDVVDNTYEITGCKEMDQSEVVIIGRNLKKAYLKELFLGKKKLQWNRKKNMPVLKGKKEY